MFASYPYVLHLESKNKKPVKASQKSVKALQLESLY